MASGSQVGIEATCRAGTEGRVDQTPSDGHLIRQLAHVLFVTLAMMAAVGLVHISGPTAASNGPTAGGTADPFTAAELVQLKTTATNGVVRVSGTVCGSGVVGTGHLSSGGVVTNRHLVANSEAVSIHASGEGREDSVQGSVRAASETLDLAIVHVAAEQLTALRLDPLVPAEPIGGERVLLAGYGGGGSELYFLEAIVHLVIPGQAYGIEGEVVLIDRAIAPGFSGGPVLNRNGEVVAVLKGMDQTTGLVVAISSVMLGEAGEAIDMNMDSAACK